MFAFAVGAYGLGGPCRVSGCRVQGLGVSRGFGVKEVRVLGFRGGVRV